MVGPFLQALVYGAEAKNTYSYQLSRSEDITNQIWILKKAGTFKLNNLEIRKQ